MCSVHGLPPSLACRCVWRSCSAPALIMRMWLTERREANCLEWCATEPVTHDTVCDFHGAVFIWNHTQVCPSPFSRLHLVQNIFALLCFPKISPLPLSPNHTFANFFGDFLSFFFSLFLPAPCVVSIYPHRPPHLLPSPSHRYLTPPSKTEFYDVTKWVEDVNKNTQGPYLRYYLRPCPVPHTLV